MNNQPATTPDMFTPAEDAALNVGTVDTAFITSLYLLRATSQQGMTMAQWFSKAHNLQDADFIATVGSQATKLAIVNKGYNLLSLAPLYEYNNADNALNQKRRMK